MEAITLDPSLLTALTKKTAIVTSSGGGIGSEIIKIFASHGAHVVIADLPHAQGAAEKLIASLPDLSRGLFVPTNVLDWENIKALFRTTVKRFGSVEVVVANAGIMESRQAFNVSFADEDGDIGEPVEPKGAYRVIDINVKETLNTLLTGLHYMKEKPPTSNDNSGGSIVLISSTSGYFGGTGVTGYVTSKRAITGLLRSSQIEAKKHNIRVNAVAPFLTPSNMSSGFSQEYISRGSETNAPERVARFIGALAMDETR